jgi:hypothetical protein
MKVNALLLASSSKQERAMSGYDVKLSGQAPYLPWAKIKGTYYHWDATTGPNIKGGSNFCCAEISIKPNSVWWVRRGDQLIF